MQTAAMLERARRFSPAAVLIVAATLALRTLDDSDTWWHLAAGRWITAHARVPTIDPLSHTVPEHAWVNLQWLYDLALYGLYDLGGPSLLVIAATLAVMTVGCFDVTLGDSEVLAIYLALVAIGYCAVESKQTSVA